MKDELNYIDELFDKELGAYQMGETDQGWAAVSASLAKKGFLTFLKTSLWLKVAAGVISAGLISFLTIILINPDFFIENTSSQSSVGLPSEALAQGGSPQPPISQSQSLNTTTQQPEKSQQMAISSPHSALNARQPETSSQLAVLSPQSAVGRSELADNNLSKKDIETGSNHSMDFKPETPNQESETNQQMAISSSQSAVLSPQSAVGRSELADNNLSKKDIETGSNHSMDVKPETTNQESETNLQAIVISPQLSNDAVQPETQNTKPETSQQSSVGSPHLADVTMQHETRDPKSETQLFSNINNEALPIYYTMPLRGFVPHSAQENQSIYLKQEYLSPPATNHGYNPLSWAVSAYLAPQQPSVLLQSEDVEGDALLTYIESGLQQPSVFNGGVRIEVRGRNLLVESGLSFLQISQQGNYQTLDIFYNDSTIWSFTDSTYIEIDTVDSYFQVAGNDTSWYYITENQVINLHDSSSAIITDTIRDNLSHHFINRYKYLEVPFIMGYSFTRGRLTTSIKAGVISSFLWKAYGQSTTGLSKNDIYSFTYDDFPSIRLDLYTALELRYFFGPRYFVFGEAFHRRTLSPFIMRENISYRFNSYGLKLGAGMYF